MKLSGQIWNVKDLSLDQRDEMVVLMQQYYKGVGYHEFEADLADKKWVIVLVDEETRTIQGFSTQTLMSCTVGDKPITALFSGDTIVARPFWGQNPLAGVWGQFVIDLIDRQLNKSLYWFLISKGYKTYRYLPVYFHEFYPRFDRETPVHMQWMIDELARARFSNAYDAGTGVVHSQGCRLVAG
ncbi:MAG: hypothetical protein N2C12_13990, partial [Planctomycetales bacterium]